MAIARRKAKVIKKDKKEVTEDMAVELLLEVRDTFPNKSKQQSKKK